MRSQGRAGGEHGAYSSAAVIHSPVAQYKPILSQSWGVENLKGRFTNTRILTYLALTATFWQPIQE